MPTGRGAMTAPLESIGDVAGCRAVCNPRWRRRQGDRRPLARPDRVDAVQAGQGRARQRGRDHHPGPVHRPGAADQQVRRRQPVRRQRRQPELQHRHRHCRSATSAAITAAHPFGVEPINGRDLLARIDVGARYSLIIALAATALSVITRHVLRRDRRVLRRRDRHRDQPLHGHPAGVPARSSSRSRSRRSSRPRRSGGGLWTHVLLLIIIIGFFSSPYFGRIIRGQVLSLREKEFVDAARGIGASNGWIMFRELLPNMYGPILVYSTLIIPTNILFEAALSYLGVGIPLPNPSWGNMLSDADGQQPLPDRPVVRDHPGRLHLHHGDGFQPVRGRAAGRPRPTEQPLTRHPWANRPQSDRRRAPDLSPRKGPRPDMPHKTWVVTRRSRASGAGPRRNRLRQQ